MGPKKEDIRRNYINDRLALFFSKNVFLRVSSGILCLKRVRKRRGESFQIGEDVIAGCDGYRHFAIAWIDVNWDSTGAAAQVDGERDDRRRFQIPNSLQWMRLILINVSLNQWCLQSCSSLNSCSLIHINHVFNHVLRSIHVLRFNNILMFNVNVSMFKMFSDQNVLW